MKKGTSQREMCFTLMFVMPLQYLDYVETMGIIGGKMYIVTFENDSRVVKIRDREELYGLCREINEDTLEELQDVYTEDVEDMQTNRLKELLNVYTEGISVFKIKKVIKSVKESDMDTEEKAALLEILHDEDIEEFNIADFYYLSDILADTEEEIF